MAGLKGNLDVETLERLCRVKQTAAPVATLVGPTMLGFFKRCIQKRHNELEKIAAHWQQLVPEMLNEHCALEGLSHGTLTVLVDSASHHYELRQLLLAGLQRQLLVACKSAGLRRIALRRGQWYEGGEAADRKPRFNSSQDRHS